MLKSLKQYVFKHVLSIVHDIKVMMEEIALPIRKILENTSLYSIMGKTKTIKFLLTGLKIKHNIIIL
jgi:hypothetical protein